MVGDSLTELVRLLVDGGASINLIPAWIVDAFKLKIFPDSSLAIEIVDGIGQALRGYVVLILDVGGVQRRITAWVIDGKPRWTILLSRQWISSVSAISYYKTNRYTI